MRILIAALALAAAACSPMQAQGPDTAAPGQSAEAACVARNGTMQRVGRLQTLQCVVRYTDAGQRCTDSDQCQGECRYEGDASAVAPNASVAGVCQADSNRFGCSTRVEDGRPDATICID